MSLTFGQFPVVTLGDKPAYEACAELVNVHDLAVTLRYEMIQEEYAEEGRLLPEDVELVIENSQLKASPNL